MQSITKHFDLKNPIARWGLILLAAFFAIVIVNGFARAEGLPKGKKAASKVEAPAAVSWTGCGPGVHGAWANASVDMPGPVNEGTEGSRLGVSAACSYQIQQFVLGAEASLDRLFGDPKSLGFKSDLGFTAKAGIVFGNAQPYVHAGWSRIDTDNDGDTDGRKYGAGVEIRPGTMPVLLDFRYSRGVYEDAFSSGIDLKTNEFRAGFKYQFNALPKQ